MKRLLGMLVCRWKGKHVERRVPQSRPVSEDWTEVRSYNRECSRCGARRLAPQRKKAAA